LPIYRPWAPPRGGPDRRSIRCAAARLRRYRRSRRSLSPTSSGGRARRRGSTFSKTLAHHEDTRSPWSIGIAKGAAGEQGDVHGFEVGWGGIDELARVRIAVRAVHRAKSVIQRELVGRSEERRVGKE